MSAVPLQDEAASNKRKRPTPVAASAPQPKVKKMREEESPDSQPVDPVLKFQHQAAMKRLKEKNRELKELQAHVTTLQRSHDQACALSLAVYKQWNQLDVGLSAVAARLQGMEVTPIVPTEEATKAAMKDLLASEKQAQVDGEEATAADRIQTLLQGRHKATQQLADLLLAKLPDAKLTDDFEILRKQLNDARAKIDAHAALEAACEARADKAVEQMENLKHDLTMARRKVDRLTMQQEKAAVASRSKKESDEPEKGDNAPSKASGVSDEVKTEIQTLKDDLHGMQELAESRLKEIEGLENDKARLREQVVVLEGKALSDDDVVKQPLYRALHFKCDSHERTITEQVKQLETMKQRLADLENERLKTVEVINAAQKNSLQVIEEHLSRTEEALTVVTHERDHLKTRLENATKDHFDEQKQRLLQEYERMVKQQAEEIKKLRKERPSRGEVPEEKTEESTAKIREFKAREQRWQDKVKDMEVMLETYKTSMKDSRPLVEVRMSERKLKEENEKLKAELEPFKTQSLAQREQNLVDERERLSQEMEKKVAEYEQLKMINENLEASLDDLEKSFDEMQAQNMRLMSQATEREKSTAKLVSERLKQLQLSQLLRQERDKLQSRIDEMVPTEKAQQELVRELQSREQNLHDQLAKASEYLRTVEDARDKYSLESKGKLQMALEFCTQLEEARASLKTMHEKYENESKQTDLHERKVRRLDEKCNSLQRKLDAFRRAGKGQAPAVSAELQALKLRLRCSQCSDRQKNAIITKCCHMFCRRCVDKNLKSRNRKCPICHTSYGHDDVKEAYIT